MSKIQSMDLFDRGYMQNTCEMKNNLVTLYVTIIIILRLQSENMKTYYVLRR